MFHIAFGIQRESVLLLPLRRFVVYPNFRFSLPDLGLARKTCATTEKRKLSWSLIKQAP